MRLRTRAAGILAASVILLVTGCEQSGLGPAAISQTDSELIVAVCADVSIDGIFAQVKPTNSNNWETFVDVEGQAQIAAGTILRIGDGLEGFEGFVSSPDLGSVSALSLTFRGNDVFGADFDPGGQLDVPEGDWLQTNGDITQEPCPSRPEQRATLQAVHA